eukprot:7652944-Pyramimonas_sp.AAC.1
MNASRPFFTRPPVAAPAAMLRGIVRKRSDQSTGGHLTAEHRPATVAERRGGRGGANRRAQTEDTASGQRNSGWVAVPSQPKRNLPTLTRAKI